MNVRLMYGEALIELGDAVDSVTAAQGIFARLDADDLRLRADVIRRSLEEFRELVEACLAPRRA